MILVLIGKGLLRLDKQSLPCSWPSCVANGCFPSVSKYVVLTKKKVQGEPDTKMSQVMLAYFNASTQEAEAARLTWLRASTMTAELHKETLSQKRARGLEKWFSG